MSKKRMWFIIGVGMIVSLLTACLPSPDKGFTLELSETTLTVAPGGLTTAQVTVNPEDKLTGEVSLELAGAPSGVSASFDPNPTASESTLTLSVSASVGEGSYTLSVRGKTSSEEDSVDLNLQVSGDAEGFRPAQDPSGIELKLDQLFYSDGQSAVVTLDFGEVTPPAGTIQVALSAPGSADAELVELTRDTGTIYTSAPLPLTVLNGSPNPQDGVLSLNKDKDFYALYFIDKSEAVFATVEEDVVFNAALFEASGSEATAVRIEGDIALSDDEANPPPGAKSVGTLLTEDGYPVQIATEELIFYPKDEVQLQAFLDLSGGEVLSSMTGLEPGDPTAHLIKVDPTSATPTQLARLRDYVGESGELYVSNEGALDIYHLALYYQLEGYVVAVNPRLQQQGAPQISVEESSNVTHTMQMKPDSCIPGDADNPCVENVPALWAFTALWDGDTSRVNAAFLDIGFAPNADFRRPASGDFVECDMTAGGLSGFNCGVGTAEGPPTVGNGFFGDKSWHGTGVVTTAGGIINNNFGAAGVAGQTLVPMMYKYDFASYAFEIGQGMRRATDDGASCINISGGYPCKVLTTVGPDFTICTAGGRAGICAVVTAGAHAAAAAICATLGPFTFGIACGVAEGSAIAATSACLSTLAFGDLRGPMGQGTTYAHRRGVPVVVSAGNVMNPDNLPPIVRDLVDLTNNSSDDWQIVPAVFSSTISVGAVDANLNNVHFVGDTVDIWAPIRSAYMAPENVADISSEVVIHNANSGPLRAIGGTSAAAPFITGVITTMQALNPNLNPNTSRLSDAERRGIVERIRTLLTADANSFSNAELVSLGFSNQPARRLLVDPLSAGRAAAIDFNSSADFVSAGYDASLNFSEATAPNDRPEQAQVLSYDETVTGTILVIPGEGAVSTPPDEDWYTFSMPSNPNPNRVFEVTVALQSPSDPRGDSVSVNNAKFKLASRGGSTIYRALAYTGNSLPFVLRTNTGGDNVYKLTLSTPQLVLPTVEIIAPIVPGETLCAGDPIDFAAVVGFTDFPEIGVAPNDIVWRRNGAILASGPTISRTFTEGTYTVSVTAFGDSSASDSVTITVEDCVGEPPTLIITNPADNPNSGEPDVDEFPSGTDEIGRYYEITLRATASDPDETISSSAIVWKTDRADRQPGGPTSGDQELGTGGVLTVRLYSECCRTDHLITATVTDSNGLSDSEARLISIQDIF